MIDILIFVFFVIAVVLFFSMIFLTLFHDTYTFQAIDKKIAKLIRGNKDDNDE